MPNERIRRSSMADLMAKVTVNKGSLLTSIENLLKTIESSESAVMIPTLLRDKCEFDAWELLFVAKILKASILGHSDLVEFYMNHISQQKKLIASSNAPATTLRQSSSPALSPATNHHQQQSATNSSLPSSGSSISSLTSSTATATTGPSSSTWMTATSQQQHQQPNNNLTASSGLSSSSSSECSQTSASAATNPTEPADIELTDLMRTLSTPSMSPIGQRQPQPPSLLQLTTTNNHINSRSSGLTNSGAIEQLVSSTQQLLSNSGASCTPNGSANGNGFELGSGALSISTTATTTTANNNQPPTPTSIPNVHHHHHHELKSSRSAGCLFRNNQSSGASSPRTHLQPGTPTTPCQPQAETIANGGNQVAGDPSMPVKLLLQIEQLKSSINYVTNLLENVVELYKKSIDNIA